MPHWPIYLGPDLNQENSLHRMLAVLGKLENPHLKLKNVIHITGTKGKGSTAVYLASILQKMGFKVALYTSPHIHQANERIVINSNPISDEDFYFYTEKIRIICEELQIDRLSSFEAITLSAFDYFSDRVCDFHVIEVGMGGLFDATNVFAKNPPLAVVFVPIHIDHSIFLGKTIESIAGHKLGILHPGASNVIVSSQASYILKIIKNYINLINQINKKEGFLPVNSFFYNEEFGCFNIETDFDSADLTEECNLKSRKSFVGCKDEEYFMFYASCIEGDLLLKKPPLTGEYQLINFSVALRVIFAISTKCGFREKLTPSFFDTLSIKHFARMERLLYPLMLRNFHSESLFFMDGAHNQISAFALNKEIERIKKENNMHKVFVFMARSKGSSDEMMSVLDKNIIDKIYCTRANLEARSEAPEVIRDIAMAFDFNADCFQSVKEALESLVLNKEDCGLPCLFIFTGSLYLARDIKYFYKS